jgi:hypothetical protein
MYLMLEESIVQIAIKAVLVADLGWQPLDSVSHRQLHISLSDVY